MNQFFNSYGEYEVEIHGIFERAEELHVRFCEDGILTNSLMQKSQGANLEEMESKLMEKESILMEKDRAYQLLEERIELLKTRIVSGNSSPEDETCKRRSNRRRTWGGPGTCQTKLLSFQTLGLPTIKETEKSPEKDNKKEQRKKRQSIIQSMDIPNQSPFEKKEHIF